MSQVVMITKHGDNASQDLTRDLENHKVDIHKIFLNNLNYTQREKVLKSLVKRTENGVSDLFATKSPLYKIIADEAEDMKLSEVIDYMVKNIGMIRTPIILNERQQMIVGKKAKYTIEDYTGRME